MLAAELPSQSTSRTQIPLTEKTEKTVNIKPQTKKKSSTKAKPNAKTKTKLETEYKPLDLISSGFIRFLDEPNTANPSVINTVCAGLLAPFIFP